MSKEKDSSKDLKHKGRNGKHHEENAKDERRQNKHYDHDNDDDDDKDECCRNKHCDDDDDDDDDDDEMDECCRNKHCDDDDDKDECRRNKHCDDDDKDEKHHGWHGKHHYRDNPSEHDQLRYRPGRSGALISAQTLSDCPNDPAFPRTMKVPITLAEPTLQVCVEADIWLEEPAIEIKRVLKEVILEQCKLVSTYKPEVYKLFVDGYIRKNIEYAAVHSVTKSSVSGEIRHTTVTLPFSCCTSITFPPGGPFPRILPDLLQRAEFPDHTGMRPQIEKNFFANFKFYNEQPYCQLVQADFNELDIGQDLRRVSKFERTFQHVRERIVLNLTLQVLQLREVPLPGSFLSDQSLKT